MALFKAFKRKRPIHGYTEKKKSVHLIYPTPLHDVIAPVCLHLLIRLCLIHLCLIHICYLDLHLPPL